MSRPTVVSTSRDDPELAGSAFHFWRAGAWRISQSGACLMCSRAVSGAVWEGDACAGKGCVGRIGPTCDTLPMSAYRSAR